MKDGSSTRLTPSPDPLGVRLLVLLVAVAGFAYLLYRLIQSWGQWPEDAWSAGFRIAELGLVGAFALWAFGYVLRPPFVPKGTAEAQGNPAEPGATPDRGGG